MYFSPLPYYLILLRPKYSQHPILQHPQPTFLPRCDWPSSTPIQINRQNYNSVYVSLYIFGLQTGRQKILHQMTTIFPSLHSALNFFVNRLLIC
jgi:hypothetical protein